MPKIKMSSYTLLGILCRCFSFHMIDFTWHNVGHWKGPVGRAQPIWNFTQVWNGNSCSASRGHEHFTQTNDACGGGRGPMQWRLSRLKRRSGQKHNTCYSFGSIRRISCDLLSWVSVFTSFLCLQPVEKKTDSLGNHHYEKWSGSPETICWSCWNYRRTPGDRVELLPSLKIFGWAQTESIQTKQQRQVSLCSVIRLPSIFCTLLFANNSQRQSLTSVSEVTLRPAPRYRHHHHHH